MLMTLAAVKYALGDLDRVQQFVHLLGFVNSAPGFSDQPRVINGAADLLAELFGERGKPTRAAIGCQGLGGNASVEVIATLLFSGADVRPPLARAHFVKERRARPGRSERWPAKPGPGPARFPPACRPASGRAG